MLIFKAIIGGIVVVLTCIFFRKRPTIPPSYSATVKKLGNIKSLKIATRDKNFVLLLLAVGLIMGSVTTG